MFLNSGRYFLVTTKLMKCLSFSGLISMIWRTLSPLSLWSSSTLLLVQVTRAVWLSCLRFSLLLGSFTLWSTLEKFASLLVFLRFSLGCCAMCILELRYYFTCSSAEVSIVNSIPYYHTYYSKFTSMIMVISWFHYIVSDWCLLWVFEVWTS